MNLQSAVEQYIASTLGGMQTLLLVGVVGVIALLLVYRAVRG